MPKRPIKPPAPWSHINPPPRRRRPPEAERAPITLPPFPPALSGGEAVEPKRAKTDKPKKKPTGDYLVGYARPPEATKFKQGQKGGPGRPKGALGQDTLWRKHLEEKQRIQGHGQSKKISTRELLIMVRLRQAIKGGEVKPLDYALGQAARLYPEPPADIDSTDAGFNDADAASLLMMKEMLMAEARAEISGGEHGSEDLEDPADIADPSEEQE